MERYDDAMDMLASVQMLFGFLISLVEIDLDDGQLLSSSVA